ncbi:Multiple inositol polyphosphate phosphatase 1 [Pseudolycoriella hygida]|uniref:Multiple inositol polyphosphate phosphatase 1 n=1 Tax=Pseudolycoriella hygida TaxID=35572 RepID=A0A9Q0RTX7_9DIPT|nr:Multiple inositol polyphosphate phosphatase 1 [Pseudolycoriella hygida]
MIKTIVLVAIFGLYVDGTPDDRFYCYSLDMLHPQIATFGTTTPYDRIGNHIINPLVSKCKPARFWYQGRHGSRYPSLTDQDNLLSPTDTIDNDIYKNFLTKKTTLCFTDALNIKAWTMNPNFTLPTPGPLTETGWDELNKLAVRLQRAFPTLLPKTYSPQHYYFRRSPISRTLQSAQAFASGLFGGNVYESVNYDGGFLPDNYLIPFYTCPIWMDNISKNTSQFDAFAQTSHYLQMIKQASEKLGFSGNRQLSANMVDKLITHCKYEQLYNHIRPSPFCAAFSYENHQVNEYYRDLYFYYMFGYGDASNKKVFESMSCYLIQAMLQFLQSNNQSDQKAKIWFGHDATLILTLSALDLYGDAVQLTASNFEQQSSRNFKTSYLAPMGGNLAVIRFDCDGGDNEILFLHNEKPLQIPGCQPNGVCKQSYVLQKYSRYLSVNCDVGFCKK